MPPIRSSSPTGALSRASSQNSPKKPIPLEKLSKARELYQRVEEESRRIQFEQQLQDLPSQSTMTHGHGGNYLDVPLTPLRARSRSTSSRSSRASATSSVDYEDLSLMTSVISFDDNVDHREHHRSPLPPYERAKAHLVRYLEACHRCRAKKVRCSLDHHDISALKVDPEVKVESDESQESSFEPPSLRVEIPPSRCISPAADMYVYESMPSDSFEYMGSAPELTHGIGNSYAPHLDLAQSAVEPGPFSSPVPTLQAAPDLQSPPNTFVTEPYAGETFSDDHVLNEFCLGQRHTTSQFGIIAHTYICINCDASFLDLDQCILHFGAAHFPFNPIAQPLRLVCPGLTHFFRKYSELQTCICPGERSINVFIYGQMIPSFTSNEQPSSAISNNSYNSSPNSGGSAYNQPFSHYQSPSWSSSGYSFPYGSNHCNGGSSGSTGYKSSTLCPPHASSTTRKYQPTYHNADSPPSSPTSNIQIICHYSETKSAALLDCPTSKHQASPQDHYYIATNHWMFRYQPYFRAASIVSLTLSAMFFGFGHAAEGDYIVEKISDLGIYIRKIATVSLLGWSTIFVLCCFAIYRFVRHLWARCGERPHYPTTQQCALFKITIPLTKLTEKSMFKTSTPYGVAGSFC